MLRLRTQDFTDAARALGASDARILFRHLVPNALAPVLVAATLTVGGAILSEAGLSFLGIGIQPPTPSWGNMLQNAQDFIWTTPWLAVWPGAMIFLTVLSFNFLGDGLRDALDPRLKV
jgi:peptide/nickel transport system permease protein